jgi:hypothetical protein
MFCMQFPATAVNDAASASVILRNSSSSASQLFEFGVPAGSWLQVRCLADCISCCFWVSCEVPCIVIAVIAAAVPCVYLP